MSISDRQKVRGRAVKYEVAIKPGRQDRKMCIFERKSEYGECTDCG